MTLIKIPEDGLFLTDQRTNRKGYMAGEDKAFADKQERMNKRKTAEEKLHVRLLEELCKRTYDSVSSSSMPLSIADIWYSNTSVADGTDAHFNAHSCPMPDSHTIKKQRPTNIISPELASALDHTNVSDRNATYLLAATTQSLEDFVMENTLKFFEILELPRKFLTETDVEQWEENEHFQKAKQCAQSLRVVNDVAEWGVKLIQDFNSSITKNEEQKQYRLYLSREHSFLRQRRVCYFRDFNNLNICIKLSSETSTILISV